MNILTITINPCIDKSTSITSLIPEQKLRCATPNFEAGGGGINVSRAIKKLGGDSLALFLSGGYTGAFFNELVRKEGINAIVVPIKGNTRENMIVVDNATHQQYRFGMDGPDVSASELDACIAQIATMQQVDYLVASGSLPANVPVDFYARIAAEAKRVGARFILDTSGEPLREAADEGVFLLKPNIGELCALNGVSSLELDDVDDAALQLIADGKCEVVVISLGAAGAMLVTKDIVRHLPAPTVPVRGTVGAGDSMVAGMVLSLSKGWALEKVVAYGVACGSAATMSQGTGLCKLTDVERLYPAILKRIAKL